MKTPSFVLSLTESSNAPFSVCCRTVIASGSKRKKTYQSMVNLNICCCCPKRNREEKLMCNKSGGTFIRQSQSVLMPRFYYIDTSRFIFTQNIKRKISPNISSLSHSLWWWMMVIAMETVALGDHHHEVAVRTAKNRTGDRRK